MVPQGTETLDGHFTGSSYKLDKLCSFVILKLLQQLPKPLDNIRLLRILLVDHVFLEIGNVDSWKT